MQPWTQASAKSRPNLELSELLRSVLAEPHDDFTRLAALALLAPETAARWLLERQDQVCGSLSRLQLQELLAQLLAGAAVPPPLLLRLGHAYFDLLPERASAGLLERLLPEPDAERLLERLLQRFPNSAELLRLAALQAVQRRDTASAHALLNRWGQADMRLATLSRISRLRATLPRIVDKTVRIALASSYTIDPLVPYLEQECALLGLAPTFYQSPFNAWTQDAVADDSPLLAFRPDIVFFALALDDLVPELVAAPTAAELEQLGEQALQRVLYAVTSCVERCDALVVVHGFFSSYRDPQGIAGVSGFRSAWISQLNARLAEALAPLRRARLLDMQDLLLRRAGGTLENAKLRHYAAMRLGETALAEVARASAGYIAALKGLTRKCVVLDLDNTLWGGVVGEDGPYGIKLGNASPGSEYLEFQRFLLALSERGVLLAINSKNNPDDALAALRDNPWMVLREEAFSAIAINWDSKPDNMRRIASELNIGLDALIFVDDNPHERELMRQALPDVLTVDLPTDPALYRSTLETLPQLQALEVTEEDRKRTELYRGNRQRRAVLTGAGSLDDYFRSLDLQVRIEEPVPEQALPRIQQLFQRTNQFNLTTRRHGGEALCHANADPGQRLYGLSAWDRFGDHGLVAAALVRAEGEPWRIDSFLMSCRVIGLGIETALLARICNDAKAAGCRHVLGELVPSAKNRPAQDLYRRHGFELYRQEGDLQLWALDLRQRSVPQPAWISVTGEPA